jgi:hypothetical protein
LRYGIPTRLAHVVVDDTQSDPVTVFLMQLPDGPPLVLHDSAALIWLLAAEGSSDVPAAVAVAVGRPSEEVSGEVDDYLQDLLDRGLLEVSETEPPTPRNGATHRPE